MGTTAVILRKVAQCAVCCSRLEVQQIKDMVKIGKVELKSMDQNSPFCSCP